MKTTFTKEYMLSNKGCYSRDKMLRQEFIDLECITIKDLFDHLPIKDFNWFLVKKCELTPEQKMSFAIHCTKQVLPIYEQNHPNDKSVRECIEATESFINGKITYKELISKRNIDTADAASLAASLAAHAAEAYVYTDDSDIEYVTDDSATSATSAATDAAHTAATYVAFTDADVTYHATYHASLAANNAAFKRSVWEFVETNK